MIGIKEARKSDLEQIKELSWKFFLEADIPFDNLLKVDKESKNWGKKFIDRAFKNKKYKFFVSVENNKIVGFILGKIDRKPPIFKENKYGYIYLLYVERSYRKRGVATRLFTSLSKWFKLNRVNIVELESYLKNKNAIKFWADKGFKTFWVKMEKML